MYISDFSYVWELGFRNAVSEERWITATYKYVFLYNNIFNIFNIFKFILLTFQRLKLFK